jgi:hypothetical protein
MGHYNISTTSNRVLPAINNYRFPIKRVSAFKLSKHCSAVSSLSYEVKGYLKALYRSTIFHTCRQCYIVQTQQNIQFHALYVQTEIGIGCHPLILRPNIRHNQTTELNLSPFHFHHGIGIPLQLNSRPQFSTSKQSVRGSVDM